jgi:hypothetical protein
MKNRDMYIRKMVAKLVEWNIEINMLVARADEVTTELKADYNEQILLLRERLAALQQKIDALQKAGDGAWEDLKSGIENAKTALGDSIDSARARFR